MVNWWDMRKPTNGLDLRLDKKELTELLTTEYQRLGSVLSGDKSLMDLIKLVEIELSRNTTFTVMNLSSFDLYDIDQLFWFVCCFYFSKIISSRLFKQILNKVCLFGPFLKFNFCHPARAH